jgi:hypothetical protein
MNPAMFTSLTFWGGLIYSVLTFVEQQGAVPTGTLTILTDFVQNAAGLAALWGLRRRLPS